MSEELSGKRVAFLVANAGVEHSELTTPWQAVIDAGGAPTLIAPERSTVQTVNHDTDPEESIQAEMKVSDASVTDFDALVLPGGVANPDKLRTVREAVDLVRDFATAGKPIAAICHGPWMLVEANVVSGKQLTSWPSLKTDIRNAGGEWRDEQAVVCPQNGFPLVTSRKPDDLPAFNEALISVFSQEGTAGGRDGGSHAGTSPTSSLSSSRVAAGTPPNIAP